MLGSIVAALVRCHAQQFSDVIFWPQEAHCEQHQVGIDDMFRAGDFLHLHTSVDFGPLHFYGLDTLHVTLAVVDELLAEDVVNARPQQETTR